MESTFGVQGHCNGALACAFARPARLLRTARFARALIHSFALSFASGLIVKRFMSLKCVVFIRFRQIEALVSPSHAMLVWCLQRHGSENARFFVETLMFLPAYLSHFLKCIHSSFLFCHFSPSFGAMKAPHLISLEEVGNAMKVQQFVLIANWS